MDSWTRVDDRDRGAETEGADSDTRSDSRTWAVETLRGYVLERQIQKLGQARQTGAQPDKTDIHACRLTQKSWNSCSRLRGTASEISFK